MSKRYVLEVQEGDDGEVFVQFPDELLQEAGWCEGDYLEYSEDIDGTIMLKKVADEDLDTED
jgi:bifunctional DNA-binding transcriptional regulator/antitoxin component of YhaV-PrlF toxin-antitoxin module